MGIVKEDHFTRQPTCATLGYVKLIVDDIDRGIALWQRLAGLELVESNSSTAYLRGDTQHHWVRLIRRDKSAVSAVGYQLADHADFDEVAEQLRKGGLEPEEIESSELDFVNRSLRFHDSSGIDFELFDRMVTMPVEPVFGRIRPQALVHAFWEVDDPIARAQDYADLLGFRVSDQFAQNAVFMRCEDGFHHSLAVRRGDIRDRLDHVCVLMSSLDDVMIARNRAVADGIGTAQDLKRHAPSGSISVYLPDVGQGVSVELCVGHAVVDPMRVPRILPASALSRDVWTSD